MKTVHLTTTRYRILQALRAARGHRAYPVSLLSCLDTGDARGGVDLSRQIALRRLHNTCTRLFANGLIDKERGMLHLTSAGLAWLEVH